MIIMIIMITIIYDNIKIIVDKDLKALFLISQQN